MKARAGETGGQLGGSGAVASAVSRGTGTEGWGCELECVWAQRGGWRFRGAVDAEARWERVEGRGTRDKMEMSRMDYWFVAKFVIKKTKSGWRPEALGVEVGAVCACHVV